MLSREVKHRSGSEATNDTRDKFSIAVLWTSIAICIGLMSLGFWGHFGLANRVLSEICLHIAIAAIVAFILILTLEINVRRFSRQEERKFRDLIKRDVFQALFGRIVPEEVFHEIDGFLRQDAIRKNCRYRITLLPKEGIKQGYFVLRREVTFEVENLLNKEVQYEIRSSHSNDEDLGTDAWPHSDFHLALMVDGERVVLTDKHLEVEGIFTRMKHTVKIPAKGSKVIWFQGEEPCRLGSGRNTYLQGTPVIGIDIEVRNEVPQIESVEVLMNHPMFTPNRDPFGHFYLERAFLPGQGFQIIWKEKKARKE